jgi:hypothetical protein
MDHLAPLFTTPDARSAYSGGNSGGAKQNSGGSRVNSEEKRRLTGTTIENRKEVARSGEVAAMRKEARSGRGG